MPFLKDPKPAAEEKLQKHSHKDVNILILGIQGVGKSALTVRYLTKRFIGDYETEHESLCSHVIMIDGKALSVHILDTAWKHPSDPFGQRFPSGLNDNLMFVLLFDVK
ncbi:ras-like protein family member 11A-like isoform X4 [Mytilus californianus]|uniref:ras-like protein family member 11A-like isoform X4 n=1 Tax=Mytilus californianus TaxID=6549 RepID=UPI002247CE08|nr:ras-like protein family member 11A-like isoform X4 [Mytilus californianus]